MSTSTAEQLQNEINAMITTLNQPRFEVKTPENEIEAREIMINIEIKAEELRVKKEGYRYDYSVTRGGEVTVLLHSDRLLDEKEIMAFYDKEIDNDTANEILEEFYEGNVDDTFDYIRDNLINGDKCLYRDLMGDLIIYEGTREGFCPN